MIGPVTYALLRNLVSPDKPGDKSYDELVSLLQEHYNPTPSETVQRSRYHSRFRKQGDTVAMFVSELCSLAKFCNFGATLDNMLRDRIVCGLNNRKIQQRLLAEKILTLTKTIELAQGMETVAKNAKELSQQEVPSTSSSSGNVHRVTPPARGKDTCSTRQKFSGNCFCCGKAGHKRASCRFKDAVCCGCGKAGHLLRVCQNRPAAKLL